MTHDSTGQRRPRCPTATPIRHAGLRPTRARSSTAIRKAGAGQHLPTGRSSAPPSRESFRKLDPRLVAKNPVMFVVEIGARHHHASCSCSRSSPAAANIGFTLQITLWLWFTVLFANFAEAMAEARGKAQADTLRATKQETPASRAAQRARGDGVVSSDLRKGDVVLVRRARSSRATAR